MSSDSTRPTLRAAVVGCGRMGARASQGLEDCFPPGWLPISHAEAIVGNPGFELCAVADLDETQARAAARRFGVSGIYSDWRRMILEIRPDLLSIATRTLGRCDIIQFAVEHGVRGIHAEKPLGRSSSEYEAAINAVTRTGAKLSYGTTRRFMQAYRTAKNLIDQGVIGKVSNVTVELGRTWLLWSHPHSIDLILFFTGTSSGQVEYVQGGGNLPPDSFHQPQLDADPMMDFGHIQFADGVSGTITSAGGFNARVSGTKGTITVGADGSWIEVASASKEGSPYHQSPQLIPFDPGLSGTQTAFAELSDAIRNGSQLSISTDEILLGGRLFLGLAWSVLQDGRRVRMWEVPPEFTVTGKVGDKFV